MQMKETGSASASEDWVKIAMADDSLVVDALLRIRKAEQHLHQLPKLPKRSSMSPALKLEWSGRQRRSKTTTRLHEKEKNKDEKTRASPTTPLSWSGATSLSGGFDGLDESTSKPPVRSKLVIAEAAVKNEAITSKRPRKKKTLVELKDEESSLLMERRNLKNELAALYLTVEKERTTNESLKRLKLDLCQQTTKAVTTSAASGEAICCGLVQLKAVSEPTKILATTLRCNDIDALQQACPKKVPCKVEAAIISKDCSFVVPDLNLPIEEGCSSEVLCGISREELDKYGSYL